MTTTMTPAPLKPTIGMEELDRLDVRVGGIRAAEVVTGSKKLVRLIVDFGDHTRRILSGMRLERPDFSELVGKQALFVVNLAPREMAGEISEGMLFDIGASDGIPPALAMPERPVPEGSRAG